MATSTPKISNKVTLEVRWDNAIGDKGLCLTDLPHMEDMPMVDGDGYIIAHDLCEHIHGGFQTISATNTTEEQIALGVIWLIRGQYGDIRRDKLGSALTGEESLAHELSRQYTTLIRNQLWSFDNVEISDGNYPMPHADHIGGASEYLDQIIELAEGYIEDELDIMYEGDVGRMPDEDFRTRHRENWLQAARTHMALGILVGREKYGYEGLTGNDLFYTIQQAVRPYAAAAVNGEFHEGQQFTLTYETSDTKLATAIIAPVVEPWTYIDEAPSEHPQWNIEDWRYEVSCGDTLLGYHDWIRMRLEKMADDCDLGTVTYDQAN